MTPRARLVVLAALCAALLVATVSLLDARAGASSSSYIEHCHSSPEALAWCEWVEFMQDPDSAAWFEHQLAVDSEAAVARHFGDVLAEARRVVACESEWNRHARNPSGASGLFQMMLPLHSHRFRAVGYAPHDWAHADANAAAARHLYNEQGWRPWVCQP